MNYVSPSTVDRPYGTCLRLRKGVESAFEVEFPPAIAYMFRATKHDLYKNISPIRLQKDMGELWLANFWS